MLTDSVSEGYTWEFHNSFWAGLVNGLASTPFWWEFNKTDIFTSLRLQDYRNLNRFVSDIDFAHEPYAPTQLTVVNTDAYFMGAPSGGFGWMKTYADTSLSNAQVYLNGTELENGNYSLEWYNTWSGETLLSERAISVDGASWAKVPAALDELDVAFKLNMTENGSDATKVHLQWINKDTLRRGSQYWYPDADSTLQKIACYVTDDEGHMDASFAGTVEIFIEGAEQDRSFSLDLTSGGVLIDYDCPGMACSKITASVEGLESASLFLGDPNLGTGKEMQNRREKTMLQNLPNPFDRSTSIQFNLPEETMVRLDIYDMVGAHVETLINEYRSKGAHSITWNPAGERTGIYYCTMNSAGSIWTHKMMLVK
jgi:hypothetical protein